MYTILPLALALTAAAAPMGSNGGADKSDVSHVHERGVVAVDATSSAVDISAREAPGSRVQARGIAGGADELQAWHAHSGAGKPQVPHIQTRGQVEITATSSATEISAREAQDSHVQERGLNVVAAGSADEATASSAVKRGAAMIEATVNDEATASSAMKRGAAMIEAAVNDEATASSAVKRGAAMIEATVSDEATASSAVKRGAAMIEATVSDEATASSAVKRGTAVDLELAAGSANE